MHAEGWWVACALRPCLAATWASLAPPGPTGTRPPAVQLHDPPAAPSAVVRPAGTQVMALLQKRIISRCNALGKPVLITRIVDSMVSTPRPTRAGERGALPPKEVHCPPRRPGWEFLVWVCEQPRQRHGLHAPPHARWWAGYPAGRGASARVPCPAPRAPRWADPQAGAARRGRARRACECWCGSAGGAAQDPPHSTQPHSAAPPTHPEATDVANAVLDGVDGLLLGAETLRGDYPVQTVETVLRLAAAAEQHFDYRRGPAAPAPARAACSCGAPVWAWPGPCRSPVPCCHAAPQDAPREPHGRGVRGGRRLGRPACAPGLAGQPAVAPALHRWARSATVLLRCLLQPEGPCPDAHPASPPQLQEEVSLGRADVSVAGGPAGSGAARARLLSHPLRCQNAPALLLARAGMPACPPFSRLVAAGQPS